MLDFSKLGHACVVGLHWGDEGKGKIVDLFTEHYDVAVRYNGGANAGHTVKIGGDKFALHLVPCGILRPDVTAVIGPGVVLDPGVLIDELSELRQRGVAVDGNLCISDRAHVVLPYHKMQDRLSEAALPADRRIGTTARGIGPCYADKMQRSTAVRFCDLLDMNRLRGKLDTIVEYKNKLFAALYEDAEPLSAADLCDELATQIAVLEPLIRDAGVVLRDALGAGKRLLFEGAHGTLLDIDHGTFPYVSSSSASPAGVAVGAGLPASTVSTYVGVTKAYTTRVGGGPFPSELHNELGDYIRERGHEYGTTTGRPRRCGWFDAAAARYAVQVGGINMIALMHLDTLSGLEQIGVVTGYRLDGAEIRTFPADPYVLDRVEPVVEMVEGWTEDLTGCTQAADLPAAAMRYLDRLEELIAAPIRIVSVGPERSQTLFR
jgi:adenylosuccinate synthase